MVHFCRCDAHQGMLTAATAANAAAAEQASEIVEETRRDDSTIMLSHDQHAAQLAQLQRELANKSADVDSLRTELTQVVMRLKEAETRGGSLQGD
jgi:septal ring factor EnvC (AmiA/AmiB activator)